VIHLVGCFNASRFSVPDVLVFNLQESNFLLLDMSHRPVPIARVCSIELDGIALCDRTHHFAEWRPTEADEIFRRKEQKTKIGFVCLLYVFEWRQSYVCKLLRFATPKCALVYF